MLKTKTCERQRKANNQETYKKTMENHSPKDISSCLSLHHYLFLSSLSVVGGCEWKNLFFISRKFNSSFLSCCCFFPFAFIFSILQYHVVFVLASHRKKKTQNP